MELISVVVPVYNRAQIFFRALESIALQTYRPLQIIVVDDGSTEDVKTVFETVRDKYIKNDCSFTFIRQENKGAPAARNRGFREVVGEYVIFWDADVIGKLHMLQTMYEALQKHPDVSFTYSNFLFGKKLFRGMLFSFEELQKKNFITTTSLIRKKDAIQWDESLKRFQDWDLWLTMAESGKKGTWIDQVLFQVEAGGTISSWLPSFVYKAPFRFVPFVRRRVLGYERAKKIVQRKHMLRF